MRIATDRVDRRALGQEVFRPCGNRVIGGRRRTARLRIGVADVQLNRRRHQVSERRRAGIEGFRAVEGSERGTRLPLRIAVAHVGGKFTEHVLSRRLADQARPSKCDAAKQRCDRVVLGLVGRAYATGAIVLGIDIACRDAEIAGIEMRDRDQAHVLVLGERELFLDAVLGVLAGRIGADDDGNALPSLASSDVSVKLHRQILAVEVKDHVGLHHVADHVDLHVAHR